MPPERQIQALNMSPRGVSVDDSNVLSTPQLVRDVNSFPVQSQCNRQPSHFSRVINQNNLDFPVTCSFDNHPVNSNFYCQASLPTSSLSRKRSFNQSGNAAQQQFHADYNSYGELRVEIPPNTSGSAVCTQVSNSIPCSPHNWINSNQQGHFSMDDMGALKGPNSYNFGGNFSNCGIARSVSFGAESFPDQQFSAHSNSGYGNMQLKRSSFQHNTTVQAPFAFDQFSDSSGFSSLFYQRGPNSPASEIPHHMDQLNTSQFGSDISNVESVFSDATSYSHYSGSQNLELESLKSPRDSYGANEELRTSFSSGSQCSESVQRSDIYEAVTSGVHENMANHRPSFYLYTNNNNSSASNWNHMDLAVGKPICHSAQMPNTHGYPSGALNALNLDGGFNEVDFDSILEDMDSFYRPPTQSGHAMSTQQTCDQKSLTALPISTPNSQSHQTNNNLSSNMGGRSCSLENILDDINKTAGGGSQTSILDFLNLDAVVESHEQNTSLNSNTFDHTPKRGQNIPQFNQNANNITPLSVQANQPVISQNVIPAPYTSFPSTPQYEQANINYHSNLQTQTNISSINSGQNVAAMHNYTRLPCHSGGSGSDMINKSPKHKRWKFSVIDRTSRSPSLEDLPNTPKLNRHSGGGVYDMNCSHLSMNNIKPIATSNQQKMSNTSTSASNRRSRRQYEYSNPRMRSASNPSSSMIFSDDEEFCIVNENDWVTTGPASVSSADRRGFSNSGKRHQTTSDFQYYQHERRQPNESEHANINEVNLRTLSCESSFLNHNLKSSNNNHNGSSFSNSSGLSSNSGGSVKKDDPPPPSAVPPINININVINLITSDDGESVKPVNLSNVTNSVLSSVVADQQDTVTKIAKLFQDQNASRRASSSLPSDRGSNRFQKTSAPKHHSTASSVADDHDYLDQNVTESGDQVYKCSVVGCWKAYESRSHLNRHVQEKHTSNCHFRCPKCPKQFVRGANLTTHMCSTHKIAQFYLCTVPECQAHFNFEEDLKDHRRLHVMNDTFYVCPVSNCKFRIRFNDKNTMKTHLQTAHQDKLDEFGVEDLDRLLQNLTMHHLINGRLIPVLQSSS